MILWAGCDQLGVDPDMLQVGSDPKIVSRMILRVGLFVRLLSFFAENTTGFNVDAGDAGEQAARGRSCLAGSKGWREDLSARRVWSGEFLRRLDEPFLFLTRIPRNIANMDEEDSEFWKRFRDRSRPFACFALKNPIPVALVNQPP